MSRIFGTAIVLPADPINPLEAATKQLVDTKASTQIPTATKTANYTANFSEIVMCDATNGGFVVTLPTIVGMFRISVKKTDATPNVITVTAAAGQTIGSSGATSVAVRLQNQTTTFQGNGTNWLIPYNHLDLTSLDTRFASAARAITAGTGLTGGGDLSADRSLSVVYGTAAGSAAQGNDARLSDARTPTAHASSHGSGGSDPITPAAIGAVPTTQRGPIGGVVTVAYAATTSLNAASGVHFRMTLTGNLTLSATSGAVDGQRILIELIQDSSGGRTLTLDSSFQVTTSITGAITLVTTANTRSYIGAVFRSSASKFDILAFGTGIAA